MELTVARIPRRRRLGDAFAVALRDDVAVPTVDPAGRRVPAGNVVPGGTVTPGGSVTLEGSGTPGVTGVPGGRTVPGGNTVPGGSWVPGGSAVDVVVVVVGTTGSALDV